MQFLQKCMDMGKMPKGLRGQYREIHLMDSPSSTKTRAVLAGLFKRTEQSICEALIEHYALVLKESNESLRTVNNTMHELLKLKKPKE